MTTWSSGMILRSGRRGLGFIPEVAFIILQD